MQMKEELAVIVSSETWRTTLGKAVGKVTSRVSRVTDRKGMSFLDTSEDSFFSHGEEADDIKGASHQVSKASLST